MAFEVALEPLFLVLVLLGRRARKPAGSLESATAIPVSLALGAITYVYAGGRLLAPLLAVALAVVRDASDVGGGSCPAGSGSR